MIKPLFLLLFLLPLRSPAQTALPVGQGVLKINFDKQPGLQFFEDTLQATPSRSVSVVTSANGELVIHSQKDPAAWFKPEQLFLEYGIFLLRVDRVAGKWFSVYINNETAGTLWIRADEANQFIQWPAFLLKETTAIDMGSEVLEVKTGPSEKAATIKKMERKDCFEALEIKGDWMKIRTNMGLECNESKRPVKLGWIKWRNKNRLTISYALSC